MGYLSKLNQRLVDVLTWGGGEADDADDDEESDADATISVETMADSRDQVIVFQVPEEMSDEDAEDAAQYARRWKESGGLQSSVLFVTEEFDMSGVTDQ